MTCMMTSWEILITPTKHTLNHLYQLADQED